MGEPVGGLQLIHKVGHGCSLGQLELDPVPARGAGQVFTHRPEAHDLHPHEPHTSRGRWSYFSIGTPTRLPYSVHEPS